MYSIKESGRELSGFLVEGKRKKEKRKEREEEKRE